MDALTAAYQKLSETVKPSASEQAYIDLMSAPEYAQKQVLQSELLHAWQEKGLKDGTLRYGTGTCPSGQFTPAPLR